MECFPGVYSIYHILRFCEVRRIFAVENVMFSFSLIRSTCAYRLYRTYRLCCLLLCGRMYLHFFKGNRAIRWLVSGANNAANDDINTVLLYKSTRQQQDDVVSILISIDIFCSDLESYDWGSNCTGIACNWKYNVCVLSSALPYSACARVDYRLYCVG